MFQLIGVNKASVFTKWPNFESLLHFRRAKISQITKKFGQFILAELPLEFGKRRTYKGLFIGAHFLIWWVSYDSSLVNMKWLLIWTTNILRAVCFTHNDHCFSGFFRLFTLTSCFYHLFPVLNIWMQLECSLIEINSNLCIALIRTIHMYCTNSYNAKLLGIKHQNSYSKFSFEFCSILSLGFFIYFFASFFYFFHFYVLVDAYMLRACALFSLSRTCAKSHIQTKKTIIKSIWWYFFRNWIQSLFIGMVMHLINNNEINNNKKYAFPWNSIAHILCKCNNAHEQKHSIKFYAYTQLHKTNKGSTSSTYYRKYQKINHIFLSFVLFLSPRTHTHIRTNFSLIWYLPSLFLLNPKSSFINSLNQPHQSSVRSYTHVKLAESVLSLYLPLSVSFC